MSGMRSVSRSFFLALSFAAVLLVSAAGAPAAAQESGKGRLSANQFVSLEPFIIPMMPKGSERRQFTLVVALELKDEDDRDFVKSRLPLIRNQVYDLLFRLIAYRTQEPLVPSTGLIKQKMLDIAYNVVGEDKINSIIVQQVFQGRAP